jgi:hypothetical protein
MLMTMERVSKAVSRATDMAPGSARMLALAAGINPSHLTRVQTGERIISKELAAEVEAALRRWADQCERAANIIAKELDE